MELKEGLAVESKESYIHVNGTSFHSSLEFWKRRNYINYKLNKL